MKSIRQTIATVCLIAILFFSCKSKTEKEAAATQKAIADAVKANTPGSVPTTASGYMMKANIDGKDWEAIEMMPDERANGMFRIQGMRGGISIGFYINTRTLDPGQTRELDEENAADLMTEETNGGIYGGKDGIIKITANDGQFVEGNFYFTGSSSQSNKKVPVTNGVFRVPIPHGN